METSGRSDLNLKAEAVSLPLHEQKIVEDFDLAKRASSEAGFFHSENIIRYY